MAGLGKRELSDYPSGCGWVCRRVHDIIDIASSISPAVGVAMNVAYIVGLNPNFAFRGITPTENMDPNEIFLLDQWFDVSYFPWSVTVLERLNVATLVERKEDKLKIYNQLVKEFCITQGYYKGLKDRSVVTLDGIQARDKFLDVSITVFKESIAIELAKIPNIESVPAKFGFQAIEYIVNRNMNPAFTGVQCYQYAINTSGTATPIIANPIYNVPVATSTIDPTLTQVINMPIIGETTAVIPPKTLPTGQMMELPPKPVEEIIQTITPVLQNTGTKTKSSKWWIWALVAYGGYKILK